jgi:hypothetical protein
MYAYADTPVRSSNRALHHSSASGRKCISGDESTHHLMVTFGLWQLAHYCSYSDIWPITLCALTFGPLICAQWKLSTTVCTVQMFHNCVYSADVPQLCVQCRCSTTVCAVQMFHNCVAHDDFIQLCEQNSLPRSSVQWHLTTGELSVARGIRPQRVDRDNYKQCVYRDNYKQRVYRDNYKQRVYRDSWCRLDLHSLA